MREGKTGSEKCLYRVAFLLKDRSFPWLEQSEIKAWRIGGSVREMGSGDKSIVLYWKKGNLVSLANNDKNTTEKQSLSRYHLDHEFIIGRSRLLGNPHNLFVPVSVPALS